MISSRPEETLHGEGDKAHPLAALVSEAKRSFGDIVIDLDQATARSGRSFVDTDPIALQLARHFAEAGQFETSGLARELDEVCKLLTALRSGANPGD